MKRFLPLLLMLAIYADVNAVTPSDWQPYGSATFTDGWILPYFGRTAAESRTWDVPLEKSASSEIYRLVDPYHQPAFSELFTDAPNTTEAADIIIDCSDPDFVRVVYNHIFTFAPDRFSPGTTQDIWASTRADYYEYQGRTPAAITKAGLNNTCSGNTVTLRECLVGFTSDPSDGSHTWNAGAFDSTIILQSSAISPVETDVPIPASVIFYNLQGIPVEKPAPGHLYIERTPTGNTVKRISR